MDCYGAAKVSVAPTVESAAQSTSEEHMMGTSIMAVAFNGGVVMGADSRTSTGVYIANRVSDKLTSVSDLIYCCRSGSAADTQTISDYVRHILAQHTVSVGGVPQVSVAAHIFQQLCYQNKDNLLAGIICAGWDDKEGGSVWSIPIGGTLIQQPYSIGGSGSGYIYGYCDANFKEGMSRDECISFVKNALALAMARDGSSGGVIRLAIIDAQGVERQVFTGNDIPYH